MSVLAGGFAHDLNNLLTGVLSSVSLVRTAQAAAQPTEPYLEQIETAVLCAGDLCRQVLAYAGRGSLVIERVSLSQLVAQTLPLLQLSLGGRARLKLQLQDDLPLVLADATQLRQVLLNLVTNGVEAIGAARRQGGELTIATRIVQLDQSSLRSGYAAAEARPGPHVALQVSDNGVGMEAAVLDRAFEPFFTTKPSGSPAGRGLGLAIVLGVVKGHRGVLQVRSSVGQGTDFVLLFPSTGAAAEPPARPAAPDPGPRTPAAREHTILVVDDETTVREFIARVLRTAGYRVLPVGTEEEALALCRSSQTGLSLALIDWSLHRQDGESIAWQLHELRAALPLVILSGYGPSEYIKRLSGLPIAGTLQKPFRLETLLRLVQRVVGRAT
ncbi:MAG TPA: ATP-binding protein [Pseudomonadota bacterium]|nr:ATP-binding protein [Pseudomonadota bacterium]